MSIFFGRTEATTVESKRRPDTLGDIRPGPWQAVVWWSKQCAGHASAHRSHAGIPSAKERTDNLGGKRAMSASERIQVDEPHAVVRLATQIYARLLLVGFALVPAYLIG